MNEALEALTQFITRLENTETEERKELLKSLVQSPKSSKLLSTKIESMFEILTHINPGKFCAVVLGKDLTTFLYRNEAQNYFNPCTRKDALTSGYLGSIFGLAVFTDSYYSPSESVLSGMDAYLIPVEVLTALLKQKSANHRILDGHIVCSSEDNPSITVIDEPGADGANHHYRIGNVDLTKNGTYQPSEDSTSLNIYFQNGTIPENGLNGVTIEALLEICADRLRSFQAGKYGCKENAVALTHIEEAQNSLNRRTISRIRRNVEGKHEV